MIFTHLSVLTIAQTDSLPEPETNSKPELIRNARTALRAAFLMDDPAGTGLWMDSLARLEDAAYAALIWDERWLLHFWTGAYGTLLEELSTFDETQRAIQSWKIQPPTDSLFHWIDVTMHEKRFEAYSNIQNAFLNAEEKAISTLLLDYLLRETGVEADWAERLTSFGTHFPSSRFLPFVQSIKPNILKPSKKAFGIAGGLLVGTWRAEIERTLNTPYTFDLDAYYWSNRWNFLFNGSFGGPTLSRDLKAGGEIWPKDDQTSFFTVGLNLGYDLVNAPKLRIFPSVGGGAGFLRPPTPGEDEDPLPEYYDNFHFSEFHFSAAITMDIKLFQKNYEEWSMPKGSYHGIRLKFGWNGLNFDKKNSALKGDMVYFAVLYNGFGVMTEQ